jgi:hypothetical protein
MHDCNKDFIFGINLEKEWEGDSQAMDSNTKTFFRNVFLYGKPNKLQKFITIKAKFFTFKLSINIVLTYESILFFPALW